MVDHLRNPDGVKRRRRSEQPLHTRRRRRRFWTLILIGSATLLIGGYYLIGFFQRLRLEGETFREGVNRRISAALGAQVDFTRIHDGGDSSLAAVSATFTTREQDLIESGTFQSLNAALTSSSWFSNEWGIRSLDLDTGVIRLNPARRSLPQDTTKILPAAAGRESDGGFRFSISPEPGIITLDRVRFGTGLDIEWPSPTGGKNATESIRGMRGHARPVTGGLEGAFIKGALQLNGLPDMTLESINWKLNERRLEILAASVSFPSGGHMDLSGQTSLTSDGVLTLNVSILDNTQLRDLLPVVWRERLFGGLAVKDAEFRSNFGSGPERTCTGNFTVNGAVLKGFGFTNKLAWFLQRDELSALELPALSGKFQWSPSGGMELTGLTAEIESLLRLSGTFSLTSASLIKGRLKVEVSEVVLRNRANQVPHPFGPAVDGWCPLEFNLSGTTATINDDIPLNRDAAPAPGLIPETPPNRTKSKEELEREFNSLIPQ